jgi:DNA-binding LytR/AlgR family response regulator
MCCPEVDIVAEGGSNADLLRLADDRDNRFDVAFLDISLPDGLVFQSLQQLEEVPFDIIFVTAFDKYAIRAFEFAAIDYVTKPIEREELSHVTQKPRHDWKYFSKPTTQMRPMPLTKSVFQLWMAFISFAYPILPAWKLKTIIPIFC